ncbi:hypothetical protein HK102_004987 [Quaeritorhiza haematococci]|nr:hypothetical protein HK102_004987 [Quaeritorhiza haematococci]
MKGFISSAFVALIGVLSLGPVAVSAQGRACATPEFIPQDFATEKLIANAAVNSTSRTDFPVNVNVYFHVINNGGGTENGDISDRTIFDQIRVLNDDFRQTGLFNFRLVAIDRTTNGGWFRVGVNSNEEADMKRTLRRGGVRDLNIYSVDIGLLGWATFPWWFESNPSGDGVVIDYASVPGGASERFNLGRTLTHEVGHWLGLYHTFTDGCSYPNDFIDDTPAQKSSTSGCPTGQKTCTRDDVPRDQQHIFDRSDAFAPQDPIHNFMDYSDDSCMFQFTPGQTERMRAVWMEFREVGEPVPAPEPLPEPFPDPGPQPGECTPLECFADSLSWWDRTCHNCFW